MFLYNIVYFNERLWANIGILCSRFSPRKEKCGVVIPHDCFLVILILFSLWSMQSSYSVVTLFQNFLKHQRSIDWFFTKFIIVAFISKYSYLEQCYKIRPCDIFIKLMLKTMVIFMIKTCSPTCVFVQTQKNQSNKKTYNFTLQNCGAFECFALDPCVQH